MLWVDLGHARSKVDIVCVGLMMQEVGSLGERRMRNKRKPSYVEEEEAMEEEKWEVVPEEGPEDVDEKVQVQRMEQVCYYISKENLVSGQN